MTLDVASVLQIATPNRLNNIGHTKFQFHACKGDPSMSQQQHPRLRAVDFPKFPSYVESTSRDTRTGYWSYARTKVEPDLHIAERSAEDDRGQLASNRFEP